MFSPLSSSSVSNALTFCVYFVSMSAPGKADDVASFLDIREKLLGLFGCLSLGLLS